MAASINPKLRRACRDLLEETVTVASASLIPNPPHMANMIVRAHRHKLTKTNKIRFEYNLITIRKFGRDGHSLLY